MSLLLAILVTLTVSSSAQSKLDMPNTNSAKFTVNPSKIIGQSLKAVLESDGKANIFVTMENSTNTVLNEISSKKFDTRSNLGLTVWEALNNHAERTQKHIRAFLLSRNINHKSLWVSNEIYIENASVDTVNSLSSMDGISSLETEEVFPIPEPVEIEEISDPDLNSAEEKVALLWNMEMIGIPCAWNITKGDNVVVANIDTGVLWNHTILEKNFRREVGWYNPRYPLETYPSDDNGHGTHTMGTIAGQNGYGVAPEARWIACKGCEKEGCKEHSLKMCGQFMVCPHKAYYSNGSQSENSCKGAPHVVNNSWGGGQGSKKFEGMVAAWKIAGIFPVFSQGNSGPKCGTANSPGDLPTVMGVGAVNSTRGIAQFSSVGPDVNGGRKPDISAPGHKITSSYITNSTSYATASGTSMAAPHVTGLVALLVSSGVCKKHSDNGFVNGNEFYECLYKALTSYACKNYLPSNKCDPPGHNDPRYSYTYGYGIANGCASLTSDTVNACASNRLQSTKNYSFITNCDK